jgi:hypothetical protein
MSLSMGFHSYKESSKDLKSVEQAKLMNNLMELVLLGRGNWYKKMNCGRHYADKHGYGDAMKLNATRLTKTKR